jgi:hypothetical protein
MATKVFAILDSNIVQAEYLYRPDIESDVTTTDLRFKLIHHFLNASKVRQEIVLHDLVVPASAVRVSGIPGTTALPKQEASVRLINVRYLNDLELEVSETRSAGDFVTRVPVTYGVNEAEEEVELPSNPIREPEHDENLPPELPVIHQDNVVVPVQVVQLYQTPRDPIHIIQASQRFYLDDQKFKFQDYNQKQTRIFCENSIDNLVVNPKFDPELPLNNFPPGYIQGLNDPHELRVPSGWQINAPGFVITSNLAPGDVKEAFVWSVRASNPSFISAFNKLEFKMPGSVPLIAGLSSLTASIYYQITSLNGTIPFETLAIKIEYLNIAGTVIGNKTSIQPVGDDLPEWRMLKATATSIPANATHFRISITTDAIESSESFVLKLYIPQVEAAATATTRTLSSRIMDRHETSAIDIKGPFYLRIKTHHFTGPGIRGLADSCTLQQDGLQFFLAGGKLAAKIFDTAGAMVAFAQSSVVTAADGDEIAYGLYVDGATAFFFINDALVSSAALVGSADHNKRFLVGTLEASNTGMNSELLDFTVARDRPDV